MKPNAAAQEMLAWGFQVLPARVGEKAPTVSWKDYQDTEITEADRRTWFKGTESNYWIACGGVSGVYVLDIDNQAADDWWRDVVGFGEAMDATVCAKTAKGHHYYFAVPEEDRTPGWAVHTEQIDFDVRGTGGGVIAPPSVHETGVIYEWVRSPAETNFVDAPDFLKSKKALDKRLGKSGHEATPETSNTRSMLSTLLLNPPASGGRNNWLARVAGHYAKQYRGQQDAYQVQCTIANRMLNPPLDADEFNKTVDSIWKSEYENHGDADRGMSADTGWLASGGDHLLTQIKVGKGEDAELKMMEFANFDLTVTGVIADEEDNLSYDCRMTKKGGETLDVIIAGRTLGKPAEFQSWLAGHGVSVARPDNCYPTSPGDAIRILRYLVAQKGPRARMVPTLGWDGESEGFLSFDGVIRGDGLHAFSGVRPDPDLKKSGRASHLYGFEGGEDLARRVLEEVLSFHEPEVVSVFGAWWAACLLKPQFAPYTSLFPVCAIEAASGAGKTNGFFALMMQLNGNTQGATQGTMAASRDQMSAHKSGIVWIDDMDSLTKLEELLRAVTSGETIMKKGFDNTANVNIPLVSPVVVSGEALGLSSQKALMDRVVALAPGKPDKRMSRRDPNTPQWEDIVTLSRQYPSLAVVAGSLVAMALRETEGAIQRLRDARSALKSKTGRQAEKMAILVAGAWLLDRLAGTNEHEARVLAWVESPEALNGSAGEWDNKLTLEILPWALRAHDWPTTAHGKVPAFIKTGEDLMGPTVWVNCAELADAWREHRRGQITERTDTQTAIRDQIARCGATNKLRWDVTPGRNSRQQALYWELPAEVSAVVMDRSQG